MKSLPSKLTNFNHFKLRILSTSSNILV